MTVMEESTKRTTEYRDAELNGGVYVIKNAVNGKVYLDCTADIVGLLNQFDHSRQNNTCHYSKLQNDWNEHGSAAFSIEVLETVDKHKILTDEDFLDDLMTLKDYRLEMIDHEYLY